MSNSEKGAPSIKVFLPKDIFWDFCRILTGPVCQNLRGQLVYKKFILQIVEEDNERAHEPRTHDENQSRSGGFNVSHTALI